MVCAQQLPPVRCVHAEKRLSPWTLLLLFAQYPCDNGTVLPSRQTNTHTHASTKTHRAETDEEREQLVQAVSYLPRLYAVLQEMGSAIPGMP